MTRPLTPEQLLLIADEFCDAHRVSVRDFSALVAAAAVSGARIDAVPVHASPSSAADALARTIVALEPLSARNREFAAVCQEVYLRYAQQP